MSNRSGQRWGKRFSSTPALNIYITSSGVLAVAFISLVAEDLVPNPSGERFVLWRWATSIVLLGLLGWAVWARTRHARRFGTLYYVTFLMRGMSETHTTTLNEHGSRHDNMKILARWIPARKPDDHRHVFDVADEVARLARDLQISMNEDAVDTGFHLAPDMLWPLALAFGYDLRLWSGASLKELHSIGFGKEHVDEWAPGQVQKKEDTVEASGDLIEARSHGPSGASSAVIIDLSDTGPTAVDNWLSQVPRRIRVAVYKAPETGVDGQTQLVSTASCEEPRDGTVPVAATHMVDMIVRAVRDAVHDCQGKVVLMATRLPKTVAVAVGHDLRTRRCSSPGCVNPWCLNPWNVLVPLNFDPDPRFASQPFIPLRVHRDQPDLDTMQSLVDLAVKS